MHSFFEKTRDLTHVSIDVRAKTLALIQKNTHTEAHQDKTTTKKSRVHPDTH
eukprot:EC691122.1.p5 GENE.EC691122.1~~EC691122.1.p5  ORF type:complete len:52 (-),score=13.15 EC691122.1:94-249(-)